MDLWHVRGGKRLSGSIDVQGAKNASLPILSAAIAAPLELTLYNVPKLLDVEAALKILRHLGCIAQREGSTLYIDSRPLSHCHIPKELMEEMRSSVIFMGALLCRCGEARLSPPGGCQLGKRPIDLHLEALKALGAEIEEAEDGEILCRAGGLRGAEIFLPFPSVGATENAILAACGAKGETHIHNAAREPEITALADFLNAAGGRIKGAGSSEISVSPLNAKKSLAYRIIPDRIAAASFACACCACGGDIQLSGVNPEHFSTVLYFLNEAGCDIISRRSILRIRSERPLKAVKPIVTEPYPGFPTDAQPVLASALLKAEGETLIEENIFRSRFCYARELNKLGADIKVSGSSALIRGVKELRGNILEAGDLRGGAAMIIAALSASGESLIFDAGHVRRGYEDFELQLSQLGAEVYLES